MSQYSSAKISPATSASLGSVLIIENDHWICDALNDILTDSGYLVYIAHDGLEGEQMYESLQNDIDVVILDWRLPKQDGPDTLRKIRQLNPEAHVMISSGFNEEDVYRQLAGDKPVTFLGKPFKIDHLLNQVQKLMA